jgi:hypothetical protein
MTELDRIAERLARPGLLTAKEILRDELEKLAVKFLDKSHWQEGESMDEQGARCMAWIDAAATIRAMWEADDDRDVLAFDVSIGYDSRLMQWWIKHRSGGDVTVYDLRVAVLDRDRPVLRHYDGNSITWVIYRASGKEAGRGEITIPNYATNTK